MAATILVTGGTGYIGSHTAVELINAGYNVIIADNFSNSEPFILNRINTITGKQIPFYNIDVTNAAATKQLFAENKIDAVIHFAAYKSVAESSKEPLKYFHNNLYSLINLLEVMDEYNVGKIVFSSSATVYGDPDVLPVTETMLFKKALSAYGSTKQMGEEILEKTTFNKKLKAIALRYFNPVGAHTSSLIGELPKGIPNNLFPYVMQTAAGKLKQLTVYGGDYDTPDGTCLRDYIHVTDLAKAHVKACDRLLQKDDTDFFETFNIGTGNGISVLDVIKAFEKVNGLPVNYVIGKRREGDAEAVYADATKANDVLGWKAMLDLETMLSSAWQWEQSLKATNLLQNV